MIIKRDMVTIIASLVFFVLFGAVYPAPGHSAEFYRLGVALGMSGTGGPYSKEAIEGLELSVNEINATGGFLGKHYIRIFIRDTQTSPNVAVHVTKKLISENRVHSIIGTYSSACALAIKPICREDKVLHIAPISNSEDITKIDPSPYTYSVVPNTYMMSKAVAKGIATLVEKNGWTRYVTMASDYAWGRSSQQIQVDQLRALAPGLNLLGAYWPRLGQTRFNSFIVDILAQKPDFVLSSIAGSDNRYWLRDARDYRLFKMVDNPGGLVSVTELIDQAKSLRRGLYGRCRAPFFAHVDNSRMRNLIENYRIKFDRYPSDWAVLLYDAVYILKQGIEAAGKIDPESVKDALKGMTVETTRGRSYFRKVDNQLSCSAYFGRLADDSKYPFPIYHDLMEFKGPDIWRPEAEIRAARGHK
jgi:branched-chain amino acid transport system substrate-binding protein